MSVSRIVSILRHAQCSWPVRPVQRAKTAGCTDLLTISGIQADEVDVIVYRLPGLDLSAEEEQLVAERGNHLGGAAEGIAVEQPLPRAGYFSCSHIICSYPKLCCPTAPKVAFLGQSRVKLI